MQIVPREKIKCMRGIIKFGWVGKIKGTRAKEENERLRWENKRCR